MWEVHEGKNTNAPWLPSMDGTSLALRRCGVGGSAIESCVARAMLFSRCDVLFVKMEDGLGKDGGAAETLARTCEDAGWGGGFLVSRSEVGHVTSYHYYHAALNIADDRFHELDDQE